VWLKMEIKNKHITWNNIGGRNKLAKRGTDWRSRKTNRLYVSIRKLLFGGKIKLRRLLENRKCGKSDEDWGKASKIVYAGSYEKLRKQNPQEECEEDDMIRNVNRIRRKGSEDVTLLSLNQ